MVNQGQAALETGVAPRGMGNRHPSIAPYETLRCADGLLAVACGNDGQFARLTEVVGMPDLAEDPDFATNAARVAQREALVTTLEAALTRDTADSWVERLTAAGVPAGPVQTIPEAVDLATSLGLDPLVEVGPTTRRRCGTRSAGRHTGRATPPRHRRSASTTTPSAPGSPPPSPPHSHAPSHPPPRTHPRGERLTEDRTVPTCPPDRPTTPKVTPR